MRALPFLITAAALVAGGSCAAIAAVIQPVPAKPPERANMVAVIDAMRGHPSAWVLIGYTVTTDGKAEDPHIVASYPQGLPEAVFLRAVKLQKFKPGTRDGVPVALPSLVSMTSGNGGEAKIAEKTMKILNAALVDIAAGEVNSAALEELRIQFENGHLSLAEVGLYQFLLARLNRHAKNYQASIDAAESALWLAPFFAPEASVVELHSEIILNLIDIDAAPKAIDHYDSWQDQVKTPPPTAIGEIVERARAIKPGGGQSDQIVGFKSDAYKTPPSHQMSSPAKQ